ncbi:MAG: hypothetical protein KC657_16260 [Myxococcales bacterium]|nr:hypothetical protein [Myxococcales bacterium]
MPARARLVVAAAIAAAVIGLAAWPRPAPHASPASAPAVVAAPAPSSVTPSSPRLAAPAVAAANAANAAPAVAPSTASVPSTASDRSPLDDVRDAIAAGPGSEAALVRALDADDPVAKLEAIEELVRRRHAPALARLMTMDPADDPFVGPTLLLSLGQLAPHADPSTRERAAQRLEALLAAEKARRGADSAGNVLTIFEALGATESAAGARVLERELTDPFHGTAARVAIVAALEQCGQRASVAVLAPFRAGFTPAAADPFERELESDLAQVLDRAIASLTG